jgi:acyl-CoA synthetase (AMP-forming)/AMP-acid ligase II
VKLQSPPPSPPFAPTAPNAFRYAAERHGDREFLVLDDVRLTFADADRLSAELARSLIALGAGKGSRVGVLMPNNPDWVIAWMACARIGAVTVALSTFYTAPEIAWSLRHNDVQLLLTADRFMKNDYLERLERAAPGLAGASAELFLPAFPHLRRIVVWGESDRPWALRAATDLPAAAAARPQIDAALLAELETTITPADPLVVISTSGTTSEPKAVVHTHGSAFRSTYQFIDYLDIREDDRAYPAMPFFWVGGLNTHLFPAIYTGSCLCFSRTPDPSSVIPMVQREEVTVILQWLPQAKRLQLALDASGQTLPSVRVGMGPYRDLLGKLIPAERAVGGMLGMTESFGYHSMDRMDVAAPIGKGGSNGRKLPGLDRLVVDPETGAPLPAGQRGELMIRGDNLMQGYYGKERWEVFTADGYFPTGDLVTIDADGYLWFHGRAGEMIKTSGANVAPPEVENALLACPGVREAVVFGIDDEDKGEAVVAVVAGNADAVLDADVLCAQLREMISPYKVPQAIAFLSQDQIPRTASGKPIKHKLRELLF